MLPHMFMAQQAGLSLQEYRDNLSAKIKTLVSDALESGGVYTRIQPGTLEKVLQEGRFKSQHETSPNKETTRYREDAEYRLFGYAKNSISEDRPIYGYLSADPKARITGETAKGKDSEDWLDQYGSAAVKLKLQAYNRTTITHGDSIDYTSKSFQSAPAKISDPDYTTVLTHYHGMFLNPHESAKKHAQFVADRFTAFKADNVDAHALTGTVGFGGVKGYFEAQIHGGFRVSDIEKVIFPKKPSAKLRKQLQESSIPWEVVA